MFKKLNWNRFSWGEYNNHRMGEPNLGEERTCLFLKTVQKETKILENVVGISAHTIGVSTQGHSRKNNQFQLKDNTWIRMTGPLLAQEIDHSENEVAFDFLSSEALA